MSWVGIQFGLDMPAPGNRGRKGVLEYAGILARPNLEVMFSLVGKHSKKVRQALAKDLFVIVLTHISFGTKHLLCVDVYFCLLLSVFCLWLFACVFVCCCYCCWLSLLFTVGCLFAFVFCCVLVVCLVFSVDFVVVESY